MKIKIFLIIKTHYTVKPTTDFVARPANHPIAQNICGLDQFLSENIKNSAAFCVIIDLNLHKKRHKILIPQDFYWGLNFN